MCGGLDDIVQAKKPNKEKSEQIHQGSQKNITKVTDFQS